MKNTEKMLSKQDFLSLSTEFETKKNEIQKNYHIKLTIGFIILALCVFVLPFLLAVLGSHIIFTLIVSTLGIAVGGCICGISQSKCSKNIEKLGDELFRKYVSDYNNNIK